MPSGLDAEGFITNETVSEQAAARGKPDAGRDLGDRNH